MKPYWIFILFVLTLISCSNDSKKNMVSQPEVFCEFNFDKTSCIYQYYTVNLNTKQLQSDELSILSLAVSYRKINHILDLTADTTLLKGDKGYISFEDLNFDGIADLGITTSFGVANLYLDYWVYNPKQKKFLYVGNHTKFTIDSTNNTLSNTVKINAAKYENKTYYWNEYKLIKKEMPE